jgi:hypothetical protein
MGDVPTPLVFVQPASEVPLNVCLYGPTGAGKSVGACSAPGPVLVLNSDRESALRFARKRFGEDKLHEVPYRNSETLQAITQYVKSGDSDEKTIVIDTFGEIYEQLVHEIGGIVPPIQAYQKVQGILKDFVRDLRNSGKHVVFVCHEQIDDSEEGGALRRPMAGGQKLPEWLMGKMSIVAYCTAIPGEKETDPVRYVGQLVQAKGRRAKDDSGALGPWRELDLTEWFAAIDAAYAQTDLPWEQPKTETTQTVKETLT